MNEAEKRSRIDFLAEKLNEASRAYYTDGIEIITNYEYDEMLGEYICEAPIDQDAWERMLEVGQKSCPYYIEDGEYKTVNKQI